MKTHHWIKSAIATACVFLLVLIVSQPFKSCNSDSRNVEKAEETSIVSSVDPRGENKLTTNAPPDQEESESKDKVTKGAVYNEGSPDSKMDPLNQNTAYYLSNTPTSRIFLTPEIVKGEKEVVLEDNRYIQPSKNYQLMNGGIIGKQLYSIDGRFVRCLPLSINVERGENPEAAERCADNIKWNWLDDQRLIGVQPIDLKDAPDPSGGRKTDIEQTIPTPSFARVYLLDLKKPDKIYEVAPIPPLPPNYAVELAGITKDGLISLRAVNHIQGAPDGASPTERVKELGFFRIGPTPE